MNIKRKMRAPMNLSFPLLLVINLVTGCNTALDDVGYQVPPVATGYQYSLPDQIAGDWPTGSLISVGVDSVPLIQMMDRIQANQNHRIHAILLVRNGVLVFEEYFAGERWLSPGSYEPTEFTRETLHYQASVTKSVTAIAVGLACDRGLLDLQTPVLSFFPGLSDLATDGREEITLEHMITMRSGLPWDEHTVYYDNPANDVYQLFHNSDPIRYIFDKTMEAPAGTLFHYNSGCTNVLGKVVELVTGQELDSFTEEWLFEPLGISEYYWSRLNSEVVFASGGLWLTPRDMARIGELFLREGRWGDEQLLSNSWVAESVSSRSSFSYGWADGYGYGWWMLTYMTPDGPIETYFAAGWGEQQIIVVPDLDLVAVFTGGAYDDPAFRSPAQLMATYIIPAVLNGSGV